MSKKWRLTDRTRTLLTLELAIVLPAAALLGFSVWNLNRIQRSEFVEAAYQRDLAHVLKFAKRQALTCWVRSTVPAAAWTAVGVKASAPSASAAKEKARDEIIGWTPRRRVSEPRRSRETGRS